MGKTFRHDDEYSNNEPRYIIVLHSTGNAHVVVRLHKDSERHKRALKREGFIIVSKEFTSHLDAELEAQTRDCALTKYPERLYGT